MPLGDILASQSNGQGGFTTRQPVIAAPAPVAAPVADPPDLDARLKLLQTVSNNTLDPQTLMGLARQAIPTEVLPASFLQTVGVKRDADQVALLASLDRKEQKQFWESLPESGQTYWRNKGFDPEPAGGGGGFFGKALGVVGTVAHGASVALTAPVRYPYRAAQHIPVVGQAVEPVAHNTVGMAAHYGVGLPVHAAGKAYEPVAAVPSHIARSLLSIEEMGGDWGHLQDYVSPAKWKDAWAQTANGEKYITAPARARALDAIGGDTDLYDTLLNMQAGDTIDEVLTRKTGYQRGSTEFEQALADLYQRTNMPDARAALKQIQLGKVSVGRDLARSLGLREDSTAYQLTSGSLDGLWSWYSDPLIVGGKAIHPLVAARWSLEGLSLEERASKLTKLFGHTIVTDEVTGGRMVQRISSPNASVDRMVRFVGDNWATNRQAIYHQFPQQTEMLGHLAEWDTRYGIHGADDVRTFFLATETQTAIANGDLVNLAARIKTVPRIGATQMAMQPVKEALRRTVNFGDTERWLTARDPKIPHEDFVDRVGKLYGEEHAAPLRDQLTAYRARQGTTLGTVEDIYARTFAKPLSGFLRAALTHVPREGYLDLTNPEGVQQFDRILRMGAYGHLPPALQTSLFNQFATGNVAVKRQIYVQFLHDLASGMGIDSKRFLRGIQEDQLFSVFGHDVLEGKHVGLIPTSDLSTKIHVPSFRTLLARSSLEGVVPRMFGKAAEGAPGQFVNKYWAPATLLRLAFIPRVVGDEALAFLLRDGWKAYTRGLAAPFAYDPTKLTRLAFDPVEFFTRQMYRFVPGSLIHADTETRVAAWWEGLQGGVARQIGGPMERWAGPERTAFYAMRHGDPLGKLPAYLAGNPTVSTAMARVMSGDAFLEREANPAMDQVLAVSRDMRGDEHLVIPVVTGGEFEHVSTDAILNGDRTYLGGVADAAVMQSAPRRMNYMLSSDVHEQLADDALGMVGFDDHDRLVKTLTPKNAKVPALGPTYEERTTELNERLDAIAQEEANLYNQAGGAAVTGPLEDERRAIETELGQTPREFEAARQAAGKGPGQKELERLASTIHSMPAELRRDLAEAVAHNEPGDIAALHERWLVEGKSSKERVRLAKKFEGLDSRQRNIIISWADHPEGLKGVSQEFMEERLRETARRYLDRPDVQPELMKMGLYADVAKQVPAGHVQLYSINGTPEEVQQLREAYKVLGPDLFKATPEMSDKVANALQQLRQGFDTPELGALQQRMAGTGVNGQLPLASWVTIDPDLAQQVLVAMRRNVVGVAQEADLVSTAFNVGYQHVPEEVLSNHVLLNGRPPALGAVRAEEVGRDPTRAPWEHNDEMNRLELLRDAPKVGDEFLKFVHNEQKTMLGQEQYDNLSIYTSLIPKAQQHAPFEALIASGVSETPEFRAAMDQHLADMGLPEEFTVFRGNAGGMWGQHDYVNVSLDPKTAFAFAPEWGTPAAFTVKRSEVRLIGHPREEELILPRKALKWESHERVTETAENLAQTLEGEVGLLRDFKLDTLPKNKVKDFQGLNRALQQVDLTVEQSQRINRMIENSIPDVKAIVQPVVARSSYAPPSWLLGNAHLARTDDYANWAGRTIEEAKNDHALRLKNDFRDTFTKDGTIHHELLVPGRHGEVEVRHVVSMPDGAPKDSIRPKTRAVLQNAWEKIMQFGYGSVIAPSIDALIRQPMFLEYATRSYKEMAALRPLLYDQSIIDKAEAAAGGRLDDTAALFDRAPALAREATRVTRQEEWANKVDAWANREIKNIEKSIEGIGDLPDFNGLSAKKVRGLAPGEKAVMPRLADALADELAEVETLRTILGGLEVEHAQAIGGYATHRSSIERNLANMAAERAATSMIPYIHDHKIRSQMQEFIRPFVPFQFAEEQFLKRWGRTFLYNPEAVAKASLTFQALREVGFIRKNEFGDDVYVVPGSPQFMDLMFKTVPHLVGWPAVVPVRGALTGSIRYSVPGFNVEGNPVQPGPLVGIPLKGLSHYFPEFRPMSEKILGPMGSSQSVSDMIIPSHVRRFWDAATMDDNGTRMANAMVQAAAQLEAGGHGLPQNATDSQINAFKTRTRNMARVILILQAVLGFVTPASPQVEYDGDLHPEYQTLLNSGLPIDEATSLFLQAHPDANVYTVFKTRVPGKATLPAGHEALEYLSNHHDFAKRYTRGGAWLLPGSKDKDEFVNAAYQQELETGLRERKSPEEWINDVLFTEAADPYYKAKRIHDNAMAGMSDAATRRVETLNWQQFKDGYFLMHPVFARLLTERSDKAASDRSQVRTELVMAMRDPDLPDSPQNARLQAVLASYDAWKNANDSLAGNNTAAADRQRTAWKNGFANWGDAYADSEPAIRAFWQRIIRPDIGLNETES